MTVVFPSGFPSASPIPSAGCFLLASGTDRSPGSLALLFHHLRQLLCHSRAGGKSRVVVIRQDGDGWRRRGCFRRVIGTAAFLLNAARGEMGVALPSAMVRHLIRGVTVFQNFRPFLSWESAAAASAFADALATALVESVAVTLRSSSAFWIYRTLGHARPVRDIGGAPKMADLPHPR